jgi:hypothetical protein
MPFATATLVASDELKPRSSALSVVIVRGVDDVQPGTGRD